MASGNTLVLGILDLVKKSGVDDGLAISIAMVLQDESIALFSINKMDGQVEMIVETVNDDVPCIGTA